MKELVYTSAPAGLRPGTSGFCTVAMSDGLPVAVVEFLERLSNTYRPVYMPYDPRAADNPVAVSLVRGRPGGQPIVVLSRNAAAGTDHTGRTNNLAHHLVFDPSGPGDGSNPAATAGQPGVFLTRWDEPPRRLSARTVAGSLGPRGLCQTWEDVTGDAGWAATVAAAWAGRDGRPLYIIYPPGTNVLALMSEGINLLPVDRRWDCTFTTYYTGLPAEAMCVVRGVLAGTPQEAEARRGDHVDLTDLVEPAPDGALADRARGRVALGEVEPAVAAVPPLPARQAAVNADPVSPAPVPQTIFDEPPPMRAVRGQSILETDPSKVVRPSGLRLAWVTVAVFGPLTLLSLACGGLFGKVQMDARYEIEQERDEVRKQKEEAERQLADARQKLAEPVSPPPVVPVGPGAVERKGDGDPIKSKAEFDRVRRDLETQRTRADEAEQDRDIARRQLTEKTKDWQDRMKDRDDLKQKLERLEKVSGSLENVYKSLDGQPLGNRLVGYVKLAREAKDLNKRVDSVVLTGQLDVRDVALSHGNGQKKEGAEKQVFGFNRFQYGGGKVALPGEGKYQLVGWYESEASPNNNAPTYLPRSGESIHPVDSAEFKRGPAGGEEKEEVWYFEPSKVVDLFREDREGDKKIVLVIHCNDHPPVGYLLWFKHKSTAK